MRLNVDCCCSGVSADVGLCCRFLVFLLCGGIALLFAKNENAVIVIQSVPKVCFFLGVCVVVFVF